MHNRESLSQIEKEPQGRIRNFFEMTSEDERNLREEIEKFDGLVRIFIHPDFKDYSALGAVKEKPDEVKKLEKARDAFEKILSNQSPSRPPIFLFVGAADRKDYNKRKDKLEKTIKNDIYVV